MLKDYYTKHNIIRYALRSVTCLLLAVAVCSCHPAGDEDDFSSYALTVYSFMPAPGQFVNADYTCHTMEEACRYAEERLAQQAFVSLGGFGGYIVVGFDHPVTNKDDYSLAITGNAFSGASEPGIVWVMRDENGNGLPDDTWYELRGSEHGQEETWHDYAVTYYRPSSPQQPVKWTDNRGQSGEIAYLGAYHSQDYYYPLWVESDSFTLTGTRLAARNEDVSGMGSSWLNRDFDWGYADNYSTIDRFSSQDRDNHFRISDAVRPDGSSVSLPCIHFVKIQTATNATSGWLGENSTEVLAVKDYAMIANGEINEK